MAMQYVRYTYSRYVRDYNPVYILVSHLSVHTAVVLTSCPATYKQYIYTLFEINILKSILQVLVQYLLSGI